MKKKFACVALIIAVVVFITGIIMIFSSGSNGRSAGHNAIRANGGSMDTSQYERIIESTTTNYRTVGVVLSFFGGMGVLISGVGLYKELGNTNKSL